jgi:hypothetical protein
VVSLSQRSVGMGMLCGGSGLDATVNLLDTRSIISHRPTSVTLRVVTPVIGSMIDGAIV